MHTRPLLHSDIPQIATISYAAYSDDKLYNWLHPRLKQYPQDYRRSRINSLRARLVRPGCHGLVVVEEGGDVVGYAFFMRVAGAGDKDEGARVWMRDSWFNKLERTLLSLNNTYTSLLPHHRNRTISPENMSTYLAARQTSTSLYAPLAPYWHLSGLAINPQYQRRGLGALLVSEGQRLARGDEGVGGEGVPMVLESSGVARRLYEKCGFEVVREERVGEGWEVCMVWYPEGWRGVKVVV